MRFGVENPDVNGKLVSEVARLTDQVENVLDLSQSEAGLMPIHKEEIDLLPFVTKIVRDREKAIVKAGIGLDLKGKRGRTVQADTRQLGRAIGNLLDNAITATPPGGHILIEIPKQNDGALIRIADTGSGMSTDDMTAALVGIGTDEDGAEIKRQGLGIPLAQQLIEAHGGTLELESELDAGTTATIRLP